MKRKLYFTLIFTLLFFLLFNGPCGDPPVFKHFITKIKTSLYFTNEGLQFYLNNRQGYFNSQFKLETVEIMNLEREETKTFPINEKDFHYSSNNLISFPFHTNTYYKIIFILFNDQTDASDFRSGIPARSILEFKMIIWDAAGKDRKNIVDYQSIDFPIVTNGPYTILKSNIETIPEELYMMEREEDLNGK